MESRHKTHKNTEYKDDVYIGGKNEQNDKIFKDLLEVNARDAYGRPWHRLERGLRLNRLRIFVDDITPQFEMSEEEKIDLFVFLQKALDKKLLNTLKVVNYNQDEQRIATIKGFEIKRNAEGVLKWVFSAKKLNPDTRKKKKDEVPSVSTYPLQSKQSKKIEDK